MISRIASSLLAMSLVVALIACGSTSNTSTTSTTSPSTTTPGTSSTTPPSSNPTPPPPPAPAPDNYQADMTFLVGNTNGVAGTIALNATSNSGNINLQLTSVCGGPNANLILDFGPFGDPAARQIQVGTFTADSNAKATATLQFPQKGNFAGIFVVDSQTVNGPSQCLGSGPNPFSSTQSYSTPLLPASSVSGGVGATTGTASGSGRVTVTGLTANVSLSGAAAAQNFTVNDCGISMQHCVAIGTLTTDAQGNASGAFSMNGTFSGGSFVLTDSAGVEYVSGFHVQ